MVGQREAGGSMFEMERLASVRNPGEEWDQVV